MDDREKVRRGTLSSTRAAGTTMDNDNPDSLDAASLGQRLVVLGLVTAEQLQEAREEAGERNPDPGILLRILERKQYLTPWQSAKVLRDDPDGFFLGGYRLLYKIASGSFGRVFRADDPRSGRVVAVKVLRRRWSEDKFRIDLFAREAKLGMTLKHPNIVEILAASQDAASGQYYIVMEFVEGANLREIMHVRKKMEVAESLRIIEDAATGLAYSYSRGLTHRDMKLTNILVSSSGIAKLVDFGLATFYAAREDEKGIKEKKLERTVDYAGLERATNVKHGDVRSDIYFLGCVLFEILTGRSPLEMTRNKLQRMMKSRFEDADPIAKGEIDAPPSVYQLVETMMSLVPTRRYQTPSQLLDAIKAARRDVEGKVTGKQAGGTRALFIAQKDERLQEVMREKFKERGFRVFMAGDPLRALDRFRQQPYDALIVDARTTGEEGLHVFEHVLAEAVQKQLPCVGILILADEQADWVKHAKIPATGTIVMNKEAKVKHLYRKLDELLGIDNGA
jgi:tRNA A-37 threonylcarbamoyl transferase component Bud32